MEIERLGHRGTVHEETPGIAPELMKAASSMRVVVVGGAGNFGARIVRALRGDPNIELIVAAGFRA